MKILQIVPYAYCLEEDLASYTVRSDSISSNKFNAAQHTWNLYRNVENLALLPATYYFLHYAIRGVCRKYFKSISNKFKFNFKDTVVLTIIELIFIAIGMK